MVMKRLAVLIPLMSVFLSVTAWCQGPTLDAVMVEEPPELDGVLDDACWKQAASVGNFYSSSDGKAATEPTTAWLCYDRTGIYVAFYCKDSRPDKIVAQQTKRGGDSDSDDWVAFTLDCYRNYKGLVWFKVTPNGVQTEFLPDRGDVSKIEWRGDWDAAAKRVDDGYVVEMAVPFSILSYDPTHTSMGISLNRRHARSMLQWRSPDCSPDLDPRKFYVWDGLKLPRQKVRPVTMAYSLFGTGDDEDSADAGLDIKHALTSTLTGVVSLNPDFRNVEQQVDSVDFTYTERYLSDSRPFFQEGGNYFPDSEIFYTRRIDEVDLGAKVSGVMGNYGLGFLQTRNFGADDHTVLQLVHNWPGRGYVGAAGIRSGLDAGERLSSSIFGQYRVYDRNDTRITFSSGHYTADSVDGAEGSKTYAMLTSYGPPRKLEWGAMYSDIDSDFDPVLGYVPEKGINRWNAYLRLGDQPSGSRVHDWQVELSAEDSDNEDGTLYQRGTSLIAELGWVNGTEVSLGWFNNDRPPYRDNFYGISYGWKTTDLYESGYAELNAGDVAGGDYLSYLISQGWRVGGKLSLRMSYQHSRIKAPSPEAFSASQLITGLSYDLSDERTIGGRLVRESGRTNTYFAFRQRVRSGLDAWLIFGDPNAVETKSTILLKLVSLL